MLVSTKPTIISNNFLSLEDLETLLQSPGDLTLSEEVCKRINRCRQYLDDKLESSGNLFYGINTGFGYLQNVQIDRNQITELQYNLLRSHACGVGDYAPPQVVRLMLLLKIQSLSYGHSGVQLETVQRLVDFYNHNLLPLVYMQGSLGASGDLVPLSHLCLPLIGLGKMLVNGEVKKTGDVLNAFGWGPVLLSSKEGLALINGTQFMSALGICCLLEAKRLMAAASYIAALSLDAFDCSLGPFDPLIHGVRAHEGQTQTAASIRKILAGSEISGKKKNQVQDPYSFRCIPQVHGASEDTFQHVKKTVIKEINSVTDNPLVFPDEDAILSGGNFHGQPLALVMDFLAIAMSELANISERRTYQLISGQRGLPVFLIKKSGLNSGFMIPQYTAASIVSENKQWCTPASVDSIVSSNGQEDHVSMGANAASKCLKVIQNVEKVLAIEWMTAAQALEFRRPLKTSEELEIRLERFRQQVAFHEADTILSDDMNKTIDFIKNNFSWK